MKRKLAGLVVLGLLACGLVNAANPPSPSTADTPSPTPMEVARRTGKPVEVPELGSATTRVLANPAGTYTAEIHAQPAFARRGNAWVPIDTNLVSTADGRIVPVAAAPMTFSGGGTAPLVQLRDSGGNTLTLRWTGALPKPRLDGDTAIYADALPGVDLHLRATGSGFAETLVVKDAKAAKSLKQVAFQLETKGLTIRADGSIVDKAGKVAFSSPPAFMWDSAAGPARVDRAEQPQAGDRVAAVGTKWTAKALTLTPDRQMLTSPKTVYPVYIDPTVEARRVHWTMITEEYPSYGWWDTTWRGRVGAVSDGTPATPKYYRSYFQQDVAQVKNKRIVNATFYVSSVWSSSCTPRPIQLWESGPISPTTTWLTQPTLVRKVAEKSEAAGFSSQCDPKKIPFDVTSLVQAAADAGKADITMAVRSAETDPHTAGGTELHNAGGTAEFPKDPFLSITYNTPPAMPAQVKIEGNACARPEPGPGDPLPPASDELHGGYIPTRAPKLSAWLDDADGGGGQQIAARFEWRLRNATAETGVTTGQFAPGAEFSMTVPENLNNGLAYEWRVRADDGVTPGPWSPWCEFTVDTDAPANPPLVAIDTFSVIPFTTFPVTFTAADPDVVRFKYTVPGQETREVAADQAGGSATVQVYATQPGFMSLEVSGVDAAGWTGPIAYGDFMVEENSASAGHYPLDAPDSSPATVNGDVTWQPDGRDAGSAHFTGGYLATDAPVVQTDSSYTVMAWVRLDDVPSWEHTWFTALSQDGQYDSGFFLQYSGWTKTWEFGMGSDDTAGPAASATFLPGKALAQRNIWTHVAGVNDRENNELRLYVNGRLAGRMTSTISRAAVGPLIVGGGQIDGERKQPWKGRIDDVRVYQRALSEVELKHVAMPEPNGPEGHWSFDEGSGVITADSSAEHNDLSFYRNAGVTWVDGKKGKALRFDGTLDHDHVNFVHTPQSVLDTTQSFSVAAWVRPNNLGNWPRVLCQEMGTTCGMSLGYSSYPEGSWMFGVNGSDAAQNPEWHAAAGVHGIGQVNEWTHLVGVYDKGRNELRLYVNGKLAATKAHNGSRPATGAFVIGRGRNNDWLVDGWKGDIDEVHAVQRVMPDAEIAELVKPAKFGASAHFRLDYDMVSGTQGGMQEVLDLTDSTDNDHKLAVRGDVKGGLDGVTRGAFHFTGAEHAALYTAGPVANTASSFSVSAWVKLTDATTNRWAVSQDGVHNSGFTLGYRQSSNRFSFEMLSGDDAFPTATTVDALTPPVTGEWTHLIGVYDAVRGEMKLYVNSQLHGTVSRATGWEAIGPLTVGRGKRGGVGGSWWKGGVDDVRVLDHVISSEEIAGQNNLPGPPSSGPVRFDSTYSHQCLTDFSAENAEGWVVQRDCREQVTGYALEEYYDGTYRIWASHPKYGTGCVGVDGGAVGNGYKVQGGLCKEGLGQRVRFEPVATPVKGYRIRFVHSNRCIGIFAKSGEQNIHAVQTDCSATDPTQIWKLSKNTDKEPELGPPVKNPSLGKVIINPVHSNLCFGEKTVAAGITNWWRMNNPLASTTLDMTGTKPGTNENVTWSLDSQRGVVGTFNGTTSAAKWTPSPVDATKSYTFAAWVRLSDKAQDRAVWTVLGSLGDPSVRLRYDKAGDRWHVEGTTRASGATTNTWWRAYTAAGVPQSGVWQHVAVVADSTARTVKLYVNGTSRATATVTTGFNNTTTGMRVGDSNGTARFYGYLSDLQGYAKVLTDTEIANIHSSTDGLVYQGPCTNTSPEYALAKPNRTSDHYTFTVKHPLFGTGCMGVKYPGTADGEKLRDVQCGSGDEIRFKLEAVSLPAPGYRLRAVGSNMCLTVPNGAMTEWTQVVQKPCDFTLKHQVFKFQELDRPERIDQAGIRKIRSALSGLCLSEKPPSAGDVKIYQTYCANTNPVLTMEKLGEDGSYRIKASDPTRGTACMGVDGASESDQAQLADIYPCSLAKHMRFQLEPVNEPVAGYRLYVMHTGMCVAVKSAVTTDWAAVVQEACDDAKRSQVWIFDDPTKPTPTPTATPLPTTGPNPTQSPPPPPPVVSAYGSCEDTPTYTGWGVAMSGSISGTTYAISSVSASWSASGVDPEGAPSSGSTSLGYSGSTFSGNIPPQTGWEFLGGSGVSWTVTVTLTNGQSYSKSGYTSSCYGGP